MAGLSACFVSALPFYRNDLLSTALVLSLAFGLPALPGGWPNAKAALSRIDLTFKKRADRSVRPFAFGRKSNFGLWRVIERVFDTIWLAAAQVFAPQ